MPFASGIPPILGQPNYFFFPWERRPLGAGPVLGAGLLAVGHAQAVEHASNDVVADARQVADAAAANQDDRVFLEVVPFTADVGGDFLAVGEPHTGDLPERRVRLLRGHRLDLEADPSLERALLRAPATWSCTSPAGAACGRAD